MWYVTCRCPSPHEKRPLNVRMSRLSNVPNFAKWESPANDLTPADGFTAGPSVQNIADTLREGKYPTDRAFDRFLPSDLRLVSDNYWTPLIVAARVSEWLDEFNIRTVMDIGSGAGKFCVVAALASHCHFTGLEQRARLIAASRMLARRFGVEDRVSFVEGVFGKTPPIVSEAYYLFNPFEENITHLYQHLDDDVELGNDRYLREIAATEAWLRAVPVGTYLVTYNGFGGRIPASYREIRVDSELPQELRMSRKERVV